MTTKKQGGGRDARQDPEPEDETPAANYLVDRVFVPPTGPVLPGGGVPNLRQTNPASPSAARRPRTGTGSPDAEITLRRQLSQLQRQIADVQRALADKDDELSVEVEKRLALETAYETVVDEQRMHQIKVDELTAFQSRMTGVEQRLLDAVTTAEELSRARDREKELRTQAEAKLEAMSGSLEQAYAGWKADRVSLEEQHSGELTKLETQKRLANDAAAAALMATTTRIREQHDEETAALRESHEQSVALLRGDLEPKALAALSLAEERQRLSEELASVRAEATRAAAEQSEAFQREHAGMVESHTLELAQLGRSHASELARAIEERDEHVQALQQATRHLEQRELHWHAEQGEATEVRSRLEREAAEARVVIERLTAEQASAAERLVAAAATSQQLATEKRALRERLELSEGEARRNGMDRRKFIAYLESGLAMLREAEEEPDVSVTPGEDEDARGSGTEPAVAAEPVVAAAPTTGGSVGFSAAVHRHDDDDDDDIEPAVNRARTVDVLVVEPDAALPPSTEPDSAPAREPDVGASARSSAGGRSLDEELGLGPALVAALEAALQPRIASDLAAVEAEIQAAPPAPPADRRPDDEDDMPSITVSRTLTDLDPSA